MYEIKKNRNIKKCTKHVLRQKDWQPRQNAYISSIKIKRRTIWLKWEHIVLEHTLLQTTLLNDRVGCILHDNVNVLYRNFMCINCFTMYMDAQYMKYGVYKCLIT